MIQKYTKKPVTIEAIQWTEENSKEAIEWIDKNGGELRLRIGDLSNNAVFIKTLEGDMKITEGDYIIKGVKGEFYPCKPDIFEATYDKIYVTEEQDPILELKEMDQDPTIKFMTKGPEEVIRITKGKFYFKGEEVEDKYQVYERFNDWMREAEIPKPRWSSKWDQMK